MQWLTLLDGRVIIRFYVLHLCGITGDDSLYCPPPQHESIGQTPSRHTHHFLRPRERSYWRILSGNRTFSNKWWWTLEENTLLVLFVRLLLSILPMESRRGLFSWGGGLTYGSPFLLGKTRLRREKDKSKVELGGATPQMNVPPPATLTHFLFFFIFM